MAERHVLFTGPITGEITLADGTTYDVSPMQIDCTSHEHVVELCHQIGLRHEINGHPEVDGKFVYDPTPPVLVAADASVEGGAL